MGQDSAEDPQDPVVAGRGSTRGCETDWAAQRGQRRAAPEDDDVLDPFGGDLALYRRAFSELRPAVDEIAQVVRG